MYFCILLNKLFHIDCWQNIVLSDVKIQESTILKCYTKSHPLSKIFYTCSKIHSVNTTTAALLYINSSFLLYVFYDCKEDNSQFSRLGIHLDIQ